MNVSLPILMLLLSAPGAAPDQAPAAAPAPAPQDARTAPPKDYDEVYRRYLASARRLQMPANIWMIDLMTDPSARRVDDLVTIRVIESLSATGTATSNVGKGSAANVSIPMPKLPNDPLPAGDLLRWGPITSSTKFDGTGGTTRATELSATITARVVEVMPNGQLVVEGVREININGDRTVVVLTGVVRPADILPGNVVPSPQVGQLRIQSMSQGLIKDSLSPGWLIRALNKVF